MSLHGKTILATVVVHLALVSFGKSEEIEQPPVAAATVTVSRHGEWWVVDTANFRVCTITSEEKARLLADTCEAWRGTLCSKWLGSVTDDWTPRCHIVLHPTAESYLREVGRGQQTAGSSLMKFKDSKVISRRIDLRADHPEGYEGALAHEMTHVVLADRFADRPLPRWADEGMAVLADSTGKQALHLRDLRQAHRSGRTFRVVELLTLNDYPQPSQVATFYGQSLSLVDFLVARGKPEDFPRFVETAGEHGYDAALLEVYKIDGVADLEHQWHRQVDSGELLSLNTRRS